MQGNTIITITGLNQVQVDHYNEIAVANGLKTIVDGTVRVTLDSLSVWCGIAGKLSVGSEEYTLFSMVADILSEEIDVDPKNEYSM